MASIDWQGRLESAGYSLASVSAAQAAKVWKVSRHAARHRLHQERKKNGVTPDVVPVVEAKKASSVVVTDNRLEVELPRTRINSLDELVRQFKVDTGRWKVERFVCNSWEVGAVLDEKLVAEPLYQVKATFVPRAGWDETTVKAELDRLVAEAAGKIKAFNIPRTRPAVKRSGLLAEIAIVDHHFGSLTWAPETGHANYDHKIAAKLYEEAFMDLLGRCVATGSLEKILIVHGNDAINVNGGSGATAHGTPQVNDSRWQKMWESYWDCTIKAINSALQCAPVDVVIMPGNHDRDLIWSMGHSLQSFYHGNKNVTVENTPICRKYYKYGVNLIGLAHGDTTPLNKLPLLMATEAPKLYSETKRHEWHTGHIHHLRTRDEADTCGIRVRSLPSLCPPNAWAVGSGYSRSLRASQAFLWHRDRGLLDVKEHSIDFDAE
jgi:hypothetical protein